MPTKAQEVSTLDSFIAAQPADSYLRPILAGIRPQIATAISNDFGFVHFNPHALERESRELDGRILAQRKQLAELGREVDSARRALAVLTKDFETMTGDVTTIGRIAADRAATIRKALA